MNRKIVGGGMSVELKKGLWTAAEDKSLLEYVEKHGEGNWNAVQKKTSLMRCGKSCRLRWVNHLKPNLKKGCFTPEEENIIIDLHSKIGNKWARIASQLPGRSDNEVKNYWNTRLKRIEKVGLPVYPQDVQQAAAAFRLQQEEHQHNQHKLQNSASFLPLSLHPNPTYPHTHSFSVVDPLNLLTTRFEPNPFTQFNGGFCMPFSLVSPFVISSSQTIFIQNPHIHSLPKTFNEFSSPSFEPSFSFSSTLSGAPKEFNFGNKAIKLELGSIQTSPHTRSSTSSGCSHNNDLLEAVNNADDNNIIESPNKELYSGLLDDLVQESHRLFGNKKIP